MADGQGKVTQIEGDAMYGAVAPDDFESMLELDRYNNRSTAFDKIISATHDHFWDPLDKKYIDFDEPFDMENVAMVPEENSPFLRLPYVQEALDEKQRVKFVNYTQLWNFSSILHGEQGALNLSASLCHVLKDQGAQEYAANQTREEARHVTAFAKYIKARWGRPVPCGERLQASAGRNHPRAGSLQEDHRHADDRRRAGDGRVRQRLPQQSAIRWRASCSSWS